MFEKVLILRRGEAATRVARTCRRLGVESIVVAPKDEATSRHVEAADQVIEVDFADADGIPTEHLPVILDQASAEAAHVGYQGQAGMFELASAAEKADVAVVGTDLDVLGALTDPSTVAAAAERGHVRSIEGHAHLDRPREISVLVASDAHGATAAIAECDRSLQQHGHAVLRETPSPELVFLSDGEAFRMALFESARRVAEELRYAGLLEVIFLIDADRRSWVSDVKIGLPRHHTLIEMVAGTDLVALQLGIASGEPLPSEVHSIQCSGHALDASIVALDQEDDPVSTFSVPPSPQGRIRATSSATVGLRLPADDRPVIAKLTAHAPIRHRAVLSMDRMLAEARVEPFATNVDTLRTILGNYSFRAGQYDRDSAARFIGT